MREYPNDEFDAVPERSARQGAHRRRFIPSRSGGVALKVVVGILAVLLLAVAFLLLPRLGLIASDDVPGASPRLGSSPQPDSATPNGIDGSSPAVLLPGPEDR